MGFFSAIKKFLGATPDDAAPQDDVAPPTGETQASEIQAVDDSTADGQPVEIQTEEVQPPEVLATDAEGSAVQLLTHVEPAEIDPAAIPLAATGPEDSPLAENAGAEDLPTSPPATPQPDTAARPVLSEEPVPAPQPAPQAAAPAPSVVAPASPVPTPQTTPPKAPDPNALDEDQQSALALQLREAEPRLSVWLGIVLEGVKETSPLLWKRLHFLLHSLDAPAGEAEAFVAEFKKWLERMEYRYVAEFRSELQYRLALALDMEDEEDERNRLFLKLSEGLARTREQFTKKLDALFASHTALDKAFWEEMEELFLMADVGYEPASQLIERLKDRARQENVTEPAGLRVLFHAELEEIFRVPRRISAINPPEVVLMIGVNGVGKTTTIAKLAHRDRMQGKKVLIAAADTFRAAATEQLGVWAQRVGADFHRKDAGADPAAVAFEAMDKALAGGYDVLYVDTAGRLQTKINLMEELKKIRAVLNRKHAGAPHRSVLVIDATTGQNALSQTKLFKEAAGVDEVILTKLDGTAKGGVAIAVVMQFQVPITYVGLGEKLEDLRPFNGEDFASALLGVEKTAV